MSAEPSIRDQARQAVERAWLRAVERGALPPLPDDMPRPAVEIDRPANTEHGDLATNLAMKLARPLRQAPLAIATAIATELEAARWLTYRAASLRDQGQPFLREASMAKLKASRLAVAAASEAVQIHGGLGYMLETPVARFYCDAKVLEIGEGTNEIQHMVIARTLGC